MEQSEIFTPFFAMVGLTAVVWVYMYSRRIPFIQRSRFDLNKMTAEEFARQSPSSVSNPSNNLKNLFEVPIVFYALLLYVYVTGQVDSVYLWTAWLFVLFRILHSAVHCTSNIVLLRFGLYVVSSLTVWFFAARAALHHFGA